MQNTDKSNLSLHDLFFSLILEKNYQRQDNDPSTKDTISIMVHVTPSSISNLSNSVESESPFRMIQCNYTLHLAAEPRV